MTARRSANRDPARIASLGNARVTVPIGTSGLRMMSGVLYEEFVPALQFLPRRIEVFREMSSNDATVGAVLMAIEMLIRGVEWVVEPATEDPADLPAAEFVQECMEDMSETWDDTVSSILSFLPMGFSLHEEVYKYRRGRAEGSDSSKFDDGRLGWRSLSGRAQETVQRWGFDELGDFTHVEQLAPPDYQLRTIPANRLLLFRTRVNKANPEGQSILRTAYVPWYRKRRIEEVEGIGVERDLAGLPVAEVPMEMLDANAPASTKANLDLLKVLVRNIKRDAQEGVIFPRVFDENGNKLYELSLLSTGGRRQFDTNAIVTRYDQKIAMSVLADFLMLGQGKSGSWAMSESKTRLFAVAIGAWLESIAQVFNRDAIPRLLRLNAFDVSRGFPWLTHGDIEDIDLDKLGEFINKLSGAGMPLFPDDELERHLRTRATLPPKSEDAEPVVPGPRLPPGAEPGSEPSSEPIAEPELEE